MAPPFSSPPTCSPLVVDDGRYLKAKGAQIPKLIGYEAKIEPMVRLTLADNIPPDPLMPMLMMPIVERQLHSPGTVNYIAPSAFGVVVVV